jgi:hypothetical protein
MSERRGRSRSTTPSPPNEEEYRYEGEEEEEEEEEEGVREKTVDRRVEFKRGGTAKRNDGSGSGIINERDFARKTCETCGTSVTAQWRKGEGGVDLCNACGVRHRRQMLKQAGNITNSGEGKRRKTRRTNKAQTPATAYGRGSSSAYDDDEEEEEEDQHEQRHALWRERKPQFPKFINDIVEAVRSTLASNTSSSANDGTFEDEEEQEDSYDGDGFRIQDLIENHAQLGSKTEKTSPDIINSIEKEQIINKAIQQKYWSSGGEDGLAIGRCLLGE